MTIAYTCPLNDRRVDSESGGEERKKCDLRDFGKKLHGKGGSSGELMSVNVCDGDEDVRRRRECDRRGGRR
jgi:hypothetical protein